MAKKSDLIPRFITAIVALPLLIALVALAPHWGFFILVFAAGAVSIWEYCGITFADEHRAGRFASVAIGLALMAVLYFAQDFFVAAVAAGTILTFLFYLFWFDDQKQVTHQLANTLTGAIYGGVLLTFMALLGRDLGDAGWMWILMTMALVWGSDTGAYFAGNAFGKHSLYESVSPNKSIEGSIGGLAATIAFAFGFETLFANFFAESWTPLAWWQILALAIPANILGQCGDLAESLFKRAHDADDSGTIIYGHGGILDRIDALLFAAPWVYYFALYLV